MNGLSADWGASSLSDDLGQLVRTACVLEATAPKPGNVHPEARFHDTSFDDFVASADVIGPVFSDAGKRRVGAIILDAVTATRAAVGSNTNLGIILLVAPLAAVPREITCRVGIAKVLSRLDHLDSQNVYEAIRIAQPGGLGTVEHNVKFDVVAVDESTPLDLISAMTLAADRDLVARQYTNDFADVLQFVTPTLAKHAETESLPEAIVLTHLTTMAEYPDSLILRKCGLELAVESAKRASRLLELRQNTPTDYPLALQQFDAWLRADGNRRNPGTTADMLAAALFVCLRDVFDKSIKVG